MCSERGDVLRYREKFVHLHTNFLRDGEQTSRSSIQAKVKRF